MGKLAQHRSKTVDALIEESIAGYLERSNFNDTNEIALLLIGMDVDIQIVKYTFSDLDKIIQRRHQVVHRADRADRVEVQGKGKHYAQSLRPNDVEKWIVATREFAATVLIEVWKEKLE